MALPSSGQLSLKDIGVELSITAGQQASMRAMSSTAGFTTPDTVSEFYGYSATEDITASWSNTGTPTTTSVLFQQWRYLLESGLNLATIRSYITLTINSISSASVTLYWLNHTSSSPPSGSTGGTLIGSRSSIGSTSWYVPTSPSYTSSADFLMVKQYISKSVSGGVSGSITISPTLYQVGSGTVDSYTNSGSPWVVSF